MREEHRASHGSDSDSDSDSSPILPNFSDSRLESRSKDSDSKPSRHKKEESLLLATSSVIKLYNESDLVNLSLVMI